MKHVPNNSVESLFESSRGVDAGAGAGEWRKANVSVRRGATAATSSLLGHPCC